MVLSRPTKTPCIKWVFPKIGVPPKHHKMIIFSRKTHGCWVPPFLETPKSTSVVIKTMSPWMVVVMVSRPDKRFRSAGSCCFHGCKKPENGGFPPGKKEIPN